MEQEQQFKDRLKSIRQKQDMNQTELAFAAKLTPSAISQFESGSRLPSYRCLVKLSKGLDVTIDYLIGRAEYNFMDILKDPRAREIADGWHDLSIYHQQALLFLFEFIASKQGDVSMPAPA